MLTIPLMIYLSYDWGENGIAFARFLVLFLTFPAVFYTEKKFLGKVQTFFWLKIILTLGAAIIFSSVVETWIFGMLAVKWFTLILGGFAGLSVFLFSLVFLGFVTEDEKILVKDLIGR